MFDTVVSKPPAMGGYSVHRVVEALTDGGKPLFVDRGDHFVIRAAKALSETATAVAAPAAGTVLAFELRACVSRKVKGKHRYLPLNEWRGRHEWLRRKG